MVERQSTGIKDLDRRIDGWIAVGSLVTLRADPASQIELFLYRMATPHETVYLTTGRSKESVESVLDAQPFSTGQVDVHEIDAEQPLESVGQLLPTLADAETIVIDRVDLLERTDRSAYRDFLNDLRELVSQIDAVAYLHATTGPDRPPLRDVTEYLSDVVVDVDLLVSEEIVARLAILKYRRGRALRGTLEFHLTDDVDFDQTRMIGV